MFKIRGVEVGLRTRLAAARWRDLPSNDANPTSHPGLQGSRHELCRGTLPRLILGCRQALKNQVNEALNCYNALYKLASSYSVVQCALWLRKENAMCVRRISCVYARLRPCLRQQVLTVCLSKLTLHSKQDLLW